MKLEEGMFIRNHLGRIEKIQTLEPYNDKQCINNHEYSNNVIKASHNIIDLIEVGDYVNGYYVTTGNQGVGSIYIAEIDGLGLKKKLYESDIKTIVTKQQMESMQYEVK